MSEYICSSSSEESPCHCEAIRKELKEMGLEKLRLQSELIDASVHGDWYKRCKSAEFSLKVISDYVDSLKRRLSTIDREME